MHLVPGHLRPQFSDQLCGHVIRFLAACSGHPSEKRGWAVNQLPPGYELAPMVGKDASQGLHPIARVRLEREVWGFLLRLLPQ